MPPQKPSQDLPGLTSGANEHFTYGRFESAIVHFHRTLTDALARISNE